MGAVSGRGKALAYSFSLSSCVSAALIPSPRPDSPSPIHLHPLSHSFAHTAARACFRSFLRRLTPPPLLPRGGRGDETHQRIHQIKNAIIKKSSPLCRKASALPERPLPLPLSYCRLLRTHPPCLCATLYSHDVAPSHRRSVPCRSRRVVRTGRTLRSPGHPRALFPPPIPGPVPLPVPRPLPRTRTSGFLSRKKKERKKKCYRSRALSRRVRARGAISIMKRNRSVLPLPSSPRLLLLLVLLRRRRESHREDECTTDR